MSNANLHVNLFYDPIITSLTAALYTADNIPNFLLPVPFVIVARYVFYQNGVEFAAIDAGDIVTLTITPPTCVDEYRVVVTYTANGFVQPASVATVIVGLNYINGASFIAKILNPNQTVTLTILSPPNGAITPVDIKWSYNYQPLIPPNPASVIASQNGIYEVSFRALENTFIYFSTVEVTEVIPVSYLKLTGSNGSIYGVSGTPLVAQALFATPVNAAPPFRYKITVNGQTVSNEAYISLENLNPGDILYFFACNCACLRLVANTFILSCSIGSGIAPQLEGEGGAALASVSSLNSDTLQKKITIKHKKR